MDPENIGGQSQNASDTESSPEDTRHQRDQLEDSNDAIGIEDVTEENECSDGTKGDSKEEKQDEAHYDIPKPVHCDSLSSPKYENIGDYKDKSGQNFEAENTTTGALNRTDTLNGTTRGLPRTYRKCRQHSLEDVVFYCLPCEEQICQRCLVPKHLHHDVNNLEDAINLFRAKINEKLQMATAQAINWKRDLIKLKDMQTSFQISLDKEYDKIDKCVKENADRICLEGKRLSNELDSVGQRISDSIAADKERLQNQMETLRSELESSSAAVMESAPNHPTIKTQYALLENVTQQWQDARNLRLQQDKKTYSTVHFEEQSPDNTRSIGKIIMPYQLHLIQEFGGVLMAASTAQATNGNFLVGDEEGCEVLVYRKQNDLYNQHTALAFSDPPLGVAVTSANQYLVSTKDSIMAFSLTGDWMPSFTSSLSKSSCIGPLYVSHERLFGGHVRSPFITEFDSSGDPMRTIYTHHTPRRFVLVNSTQMAVCYHDAPGVDVINFEKQMTNEVPVLHHMDIDLPLSLCFDDKSNCLFVGSSQREQKPYELRSKRYVEGTGVIDQYCCMTGQFVGRLTRGLCSPLCMTMTTDGTLAVADGKSVKLYEVQQSHLD